MYEFIETTTGWMVCWGPAAQVTQHRTSEEVKEIEAKIALSKHEEAQLAVMGWELPRV